MRRKVIYRHTSLLAVQKPVRNLRHSLEGAISCLEVEVRRPVVGEILTETTRGARCELGHVGGRDRSIEGILQQSAKVEPIVLQEHILLRQFGEGAETG